MKRVIVLQCLSYDQAEMSVQRLMEQVEQDGLRFHAGQRVLLKPNLLSDSLPEQAVTTHPILIQTLLRFLKARGTCPAVADSPAGALRIEQVWERTGIRAVCEAEQVPLLNLEQAGSVVFHFEKVAFAVARPVLEADLLLNVPKVKTHVLTVLTAGVKNLYGTLPGFQKALLHRHFPTPWDIGRFLAHLAGLIRPGLTLADAVIGMEGDGPSGGHPRRLGFVAASRDVFALDMALCRLLNIPPQQVPFLPHASNPSLSELEIVGDPPPAPMQIALPKTWRSRIIPRPVVRLLKPFLWIHPLLDPTRCIRCGRCAKGCPAQALSPQQSVPPKLIPPRCIGCCCCHELCPVKAIRMIESPLMKALSRGRLT